MPDTNQKPLAINRRAFLLSTAALTTSRIAESAHTDCDAADAAAQMASVMQPEAFPTATFRPNAPNDTIRHLLEIAHRNELRREAGLPLVSVAKELRRMFENKQRDEFERFAAIRRDAVLDEVVKRWKEAGGLGWRPNSITGMGIQSQVNQILWEEYRTKRRARTVV